MTEGRRKMASGPGELGDLIKAVNAIKAAWNNEQHDHAWQAVVIQQAEQLLMLVRKEDASKAT